MDQPQQIMPKTRKKTWLWIGFLSITAAIGVSIFVWLLLQNSNVDLAGFDFSLPRHKATQINQISGWKTYTNTDYGFEFQYPTGWFTEDCGLQGVIIGNSEIGSPPCGWAGPALPPVQSNIGDDGDITISLYPTSGADSTNINSETQYFKQRYKLLSKKAITVQAGSGTELKGINQDTGWYITEVLVPYKDKLLVATSEIQNKSFLDIFSSILSSFKFIK